MLILSFILLATMLIASIGYIITSKPLRELRKQELDSLHAKATQTAKQATETTKAESDRVHHEGEHEGENKDNKSPIDESAASSSTQPSDNHL